MSLIWLFAFMKSLFTTIALFISQLLLAQEFFEEMIKYSVKTSLPLHGSMIKEEGALHIQFAPNKIRLEFLELNKEANEPGYLIDLDSGKVFTVDRNDKTYTVKKLTKRKPSAEVSESKTIAGFATTSISLGEISLPGFFSNALSAKSILRVADKLTYNLPEEYVGNTELIMVQKGKIALGADFYIMPQFDFPVGDTTADDAFLIFEAKEILPQSIDRASLSIPTDFVLRTPFDYTTDTVAVSVDTTVVMADTVYGPVDTMGLEQYKQYKSTAPKKKKSPKKKPSSAKENATRRKND
jgi:hypothetical protein